MSENNPIAVFTSHVFEESIDYLRVFEFLEGVDGFYYINVSKPENIPQTEGLEALKDELMQQIKASEAVIVLSSDYEQRPEIVQYIMDVAERYTKGMVALRSFGSAAETPAELLGRCQEHVEWNNREIADALTRLARGEDTARWEVLDFPGFDSDGPTD